MELQSDSVPYFLVHSGLTRSKNEQRVATFLNPPTAIIRLLDPHSPMPDDQRSYLCTLGVKTVLIMPLTSREQANGRLTSRFMGERDFHPEELEIARAFNPSQLGHSSDSIDKKRQAIRRSS